MTTTFLNTKKISEVENKIPNTNKVSDNSMYTTTQKVNMLTAENFTARLKQANLANYFK